ncbi:GTPase IMAP family member 2-like [Poecilia formosa]|uniref:GTPase IMAP family member 2-like n=1 Tax=Poecilia formosa TaxID=48698 RepID=UPI0007B97F99|nr:PREDICTED: GTPase IMAP family member 2-like [Poecilia formosa]
MRLVLLGKNWYNKSSVANLLLGQNVFNKEEEPNKSIKASGMIRNTNMVLINTPDLLHPFISDLQLKELVEDCMSLSLPGPHVFLLVVQQNITNQEKQRLYMVLELFSEDSFRHSLVLISTPGWETPDIASSFHQQPLQDLISKCGEKWIKLQPDPTELLWNLSEILRNNNENHIICGRPSPQPIKASSSLLDSALGFDNGVKTLQRNDSQKFVRPEFRRQQQHQSPAHLDVTETKSPEPASSFKSIMSGWQAFAGKMEQQAQLPLKKNQNPQRHSLKISKSTGEGA